MSIFRSQEATQEIEVIKNKKKKCAKFYPPKFQEGNGFDHFFILSELNTGEQLSQNIVQERNSEQKIEGLIKH